MKSKATLLALLILLLMPGIFYSDALYYYHGESQFCTSKLIKIYTFSYHLPNANVRSSVNSGNNVSIKICEYNPPPPPHSQKLINVTKICLPKSSKVFLIPIIYNISKNGPKLSYCCISLTFTSLPNTYKACLVTKAKPQNKTFYFVTECNYYFVNVCWTFCGPPPPTAWANILLMFIVQEGGANYVYFWSINITLSPAHPPPPPGPPPPPPPPSPYCYIVEYPNLCPLKVAQIIFSLYKL
ncbi:hypothetical protein Ahos_0159 [Acidianus hospitalis W1]|uniref:Uncharacterized protein n=1 Tax=Acidianus hospitalis (strain W1) TaxID=933801 RepID=F4B4G3_ACIHW|nr:hypothetical protein [Acidianus hospitalis]AEE93052.1 hypothetical protein Ahos_0159 [Acidianus hospitalis W1]